MKVKVTFFSKYLCAFFTISGFILSNILQVLLILFLMDLEFTDQWKIPRISKNVFFSLCDKIECKGTYTFEVEVTLKILFNLFLMSLFWIQHILFANSNVKDYLSSISSFGIYERGLFVFSNITY